MENIDWEIRSGRSSSQFIATLEQDTKIIDYQLQLINSRDMESVIPLAVIKRNDHLIISAELGMNNTYETVDAEHKGKPKTGLERLIQLSEIIGVAEEYLFLPQQILIHPDTIRYQNSIYDDTEIQPMLVILPSNSIVDHDNLVEESLIPDWARFYGFSDDLQLELLESYQSGQWSGLTTAAKSVIENEMMINKTPKKKSRFMAVMKQPGNFENRYNGRSRLLIGWLMAAAVYLLLLRIQIIPNWRLFKIIMSTILVLFGIIFIIRTDKPFSLPKISKLFKLPDIEMFRGKSANNCTELISRNADSYGMAILSEGLPGTPQENEGKRAFILLDEFIIGRDEALSDLCLESKTVGRKHARICRHEGSYFIADLGPKNGTRLDGRRLNRNEEYLLPDRCRLQFADYVLFFQNEEPL